MRLTLTPRTAPINTRTGHQNIVYNRENALAPYPSTLFVLDLAIVQYCGFVELYAAPVYRLGKRYLVWVEEFPA